MLEVLRSGHLSLGPRVPAFEDAFAARIGARHASAGLLVPPGLHLALRAVGVAAGDEVVTTPFSFVATANAPGLRGRPAGLRRHRSGDAQPGPGRGRRPTGAHDSAAARPHLRLPRRPAGVRAPRAADRRGRGRVAGGALRGRHHRRGARPSGDLRVLRQQADHHRRGRDDRPRLGGAQAADRLASATRAARPTWTGSTTTGSASTTASRISRARSAPAQLDPARRAPLRPRAGGRGPYREALAPLAAEHGLALPCEDAGGNQAQLVRLPACSCRRASIATPRSLALREHGVQSKPYLPAIHLMSYYRERFGHRPGEFPVCERVSASSLALPFFPEMTEAAGRPRGRRARPGHRGLT